MVVPGEAFQRNDGGEVGPDAAWNRAEPRLPADCQRRRERDVRPVAEL